MADVRSEPTYGSPVGWAPLASVGALDCNGVAAVDAIDETESPFAFVALTVNVYATPFVSPANVEGEAFPEIVDPSFAVIVYPVIVDPPLFVGAVNVITTLPFPAAAVTFVGAFGTVEGVKEDDDVEDADVPIPFIATTLNVYAVPFVNPLTTQLFVGAEVVQLPAEIFPAVYAVAI